MLAKLLKRKESRQTIVSEQVSYTSEQPINPPGSSSSLIAPTQQQTNNAGQPLLQYRYQRPDLLGKVSVSILHLNF